jgi:hypothetical protein
MSMQSGIWLTHGPQAAGMSMRPRDEQTCLDAAAGRCDALDAMPMGSTWDQDDKTVARAWKRAMLAATGRWNSIHMARVNRPKAIRRFASRRLCNTGTGTSVTGEGLADMVLATFSTETAAQITRSVLQQTTRRHVRHG